MTKFCAVFFKTEANSHSLTLRHESALNDQVAVMPLAVGQISGNLGVIPLSDLLRYEPKEVSYLHGRGQEYFSAGTVFCGRHGRNRRAQSWEFEGQKAANIAHELAHANEAIHPSHHS